jgi:hypothetical protein
LAAKELEVVLEQVVAEKEPECESRKGARVEEHSPGEDAAKWKRTRTGSKPMVEDFATACQPLVRYVLGVLNTEVLNADEHMLRIYGQIGPYQHVFVNKYGEEVCEIKFRIHFQDALANREPAIALDGIQVMDRFLRQGWCTAVLKALSTNFRKGSPFRIRAVTLNAISKQMKAVLDKLKVDYSKGSSCVWDSVFD